MNLTHLSLFSGVGGLDLASEWAGFETVGQCEWADYPRSVLEKHWPELPRWRDIRTLTKESFNEQTGLHTVDVISGGFPCQPFSVAGKRRGKEDDRYLWPEMLRVISEIRPAWVYGENVAGIVNMALDQVLSDLEAIGYETQAFIIPACGVDAPHRRYRVFIVGNAKHNGLSAAEITRSIRTASGNLKERKNETGESERTSEPENGADVANSDGDGLQGRVSNETQKRCDSNQINSPISESSNVPYTDSKGFQTFGVQSRIREAKRETRSSLKRGSMLGGEWNPNWWQLEPDVGRVANGIPNRVDRLKCLGNAVVPQQAYPIFKAIAEIELGG